ncbi:MAG: hypothetical protein NT098_01115 [Candidatus Parcubacteria bacterium]|nr:hypothetical protein [Candidatus Parcubacteria bacterium]
MKKYYLLLVIFLFFFSVSANVFAVEGTCSSHGGVNCTAGKDWDGSAICNDGWTDSSERYSEVVMCKNTVKNFCTQTEYITIKNKYNVEIEQNALKSLEPEYNLLVQETLHPVPNESMSIIRDQTIRSLELSSKMRTLQDELQFKYYQIDRECEYSGTGLINAQKEVQEVLRKLNESTTQTQTYIPPSQKTTSKIILDTGPILTNDERCVKLGFGAWYNTEKQTCDTCPANTERTTGTNTCKPKQATTKETIKAPVVPVTAPVQKTKIEEPKPLEKEVFSPIEKQSTTTVIKASSNTTNLTSKEIKKENFITRIWKKFFSWF